MKVCVYVVLSLSYTVFIHLSDDARSTEYKSSHPKQKRTSNPYKTTKTSSNYMHRKSFSPSHSQQNL